MDSEPVRIRNLQPEDIKSAMGLVLSEGWNQTEKDWGLLIRNTQNVCLAAEVGGELVATATAINYSNDVAWVGMVLVNKKYRGRGISKILLNSIFDKLKSCKSIKLDATPAGRHVYNKVGFADEYMISRMANNPHEDFNFDIRGIAPERIQEEDITAVIAFDKHLFGADRSQLIRSLINDYPEKSWLIKRGSQISGFALGREGNKYHQIGPVSALSAGDAQILLAGALKYLSRQSVVIDILDDKQELAEWLSSAGFVKQRGFIRMFRKNNPYPGEVSLQYLISGPEFG
ncbi:hypothetical protein MNBD_BACTEROID01-496 [hydrothermal vent metagenome]|uniref:N-acetyltransferase domain-containing protein n=1 Tax=hydrothermal vent metagenome TaxID=652676 RepID=A0A3B0TEJ1_9ZZZZ